MPPYDPNVKEKFRDEEYVRFEDVFFTKYDQVDLLRHTQVSSRDFVDFIQNELKFKPK